MIERLSQLFRKFHKQPYFVEPTPNPALNDTSYQDARRETDALRARLALLTAELPLTQAEIKKNAATADNSNAL